MKAVMLAAAIVMLGAGGAHAGEGKTIDCKETRFKFEAPGYEVDCKDWSQDSVNVGGETIAVRVFNLHAVSHADGTFLDVVDDHILGSTRVFYHKTSLEGDVDRYYTGNFTGWADEEDVGNFTVKRLTADFKDGGDPLDCVAFRQLGGRRFQGVGGMTVGLACSTDGRDHALAALKHLTGGDD
jgi:hypothetical protein